MQFIDLHKQFEQIEAEIRKGMDAVYEHKRFILGPEVSSLEEELATYTGRKHVIACASGTDALVLPLRAFQLSVKDAVFVPSFTFFATAESVSLAGGTPVLVDVEENFFNICPQSLESSIEKVLEKGELIPRGIIPVDLFGHPADFAEIERIAKKYNLFILEDAAQGFGGEYVGKRAGSLGDVSATSFFPAKPLGCYGDGGALFLDDDQMAETIRSIHVHGQGKDRYDNVAIGLNSRLDTMQAVVLLEKMKIFPKEVEQRNWVAAEYTRRLKDYVKTPVVQEGCISSWAQYTLQAENEEDRESIIEGLKNKGIPVMIYYPIPIHLSTAYQGEEKYCDDFSVSERLSKTVFSLPMHPYLEKENISTISNAIIETLK